MRHKLTDFLGNEVITGDVMLNFGEGRGCLMGSDYVFHLKLWEIPKVSDGRGIYYTMEGKQTHFYWASLGNSIMVDMGLMPDGFEYSFKHGMTDINSKIENGTLLELIENSDWKAHEIKKGEIERFEFMKTLEINTIEDLKKNANELIKDGIIPYEIVSKVLAVTKTGRASVYNGEIGYAAMNDELNYIHIIHALIVEKE